MIPQFPQNSSEWRQAIEQGIGLPHSAGQAAYEAGRYPYPVLAAWLRRTYSAAAGYRPDFVPALTRNLHGLVDWVYGNGREPHWPGNDDAPTE